MQLSLVFAILAALLSGNMAPTAPLPDVLQRLLLCGLLLTLVAMVGRMVAGATVIGLHGMGGVPSLWPARFRRLRAVHTLTWVAAAAAIYFGLGWPQIVRENWGLKGTVLLDEILILLPLLLLLLFSWWTLGTAYDALAERAALRNGDQPRSAGGLRGALLIARSVLAPLLAPLLIVLAAEDLATRYAPHVSASDRLLWTLPVLATAVAGFPWLLRIIWRTSPLPEGPLRQRLRQVEQKLSVRTSDILVWHTDHAICNAAVAGILPICRYVFLTDLLLARMSEDEIAAIYGHELGHVRHRHALWRLLAVILPIVLWRAVAASWPPQSVAASAWLTQHGMSAAAQAGLLAILVAAAYGCLVFSWYCRALERQADLCGCLATGSAHSYSSALTTLSLLAHGKRRAQRAGWLHPSLPDRAGFVSQLAANPAEWAAFDRRMRRLALLLAVMVMALSVWPLILPLIR